jgi:glycosyltransferase involved in cell wall biosynthesis
MKIAIYAISKNEEQFVKRFCESAKDADLILIADTGSTDNTLQLAKECGADVKSICITPWRFDKARDAALALLPADIDVCISLDLDEVMEPGWREEIERLWKADTTRLRYKFDWSQGIVFYSDKIHSRKGYFWHHPCHEYIRADNRTKEVYAHTDMLLVTHHPDETKSRGQYLDLLEMSVKEDPSCPRNAFYYARELTFYQKWDEAIVALEKYLEMPNATFIADRAFAMRLLGKSCKARGMERASMQWFRLACAEQPEARENWIELAQACYEKQLWAECFGAASSALNITQKELVYTMDPTAWGSKPHDLLAIAAYRLGFKEQAIKHGEIALSFEPDNQRLLANMAFYKE